MSAEDQKFEVSLVRYVAPIDATSFSVRIIFVRIDLFQLSQNTTENSFVKY
jgi:hypothetical protein